MFPGRLTEPELTAATVRRKGRHPNGPSSELGHILTKVRGTGMLNTFSRKVGCLPLETSR